MSERDRELEILCTSCGFCCDGTLFQRALLRPEELEPARRAGLRVIQDRGFEQPCPKLVDRACGIYADRPSVCRSFECKLLVRHREEGGPLEQRLASVERVRQLLATLQRHGLKRSADGGEVSFEAEGADAFEATEAFGELMERLEHDFARASRAAPPPARPSSE